MDTWRVATCGHGLHRSTPYYFPAIPVRESGLVPLGRSKRVLLRRAVLPGPVPVPMTPRVVAARGRPVSGGQQVGHAAPRSLHRRHGVGVQPARLADVGDALEMSDGPAQLGGRSQRTCLHVGRRQVAELHQVHLPRTIGQMTTVNTT